MEDQSKTLCQIIDCGSYTSCPSLSNPVAMTDGSRVKESWEELPAELEVGESVAEVFVAGGGGATEVAVALLDTLGESTEEEEPDVAPVAAIRASRSAWVVHVMLVPAELTRGRAAQLDG